jgi:flagellar basal body-associated protein FliL
VCKKVKKKRKSNKQDNTMLFILLFILVVCFVVIGILFYKYFYAGVSSSKYGNRLDGIEQYKLSDTLENDISNLYSDEKSVNKASVDVKGKIIYITIDFKESIKSDKAKTLAVKALDKIGKENLTFYEVQFVLTYSGEEENKNFPIFGAKNSSSLKVVW